MTVVTVVTVMVVTMKQVTELTAVASTPGTRGDEEPGGQGGDAPGRGWGANNFAQTRASRFAYKRPGGARRRTGTPGSAAQAAGVH